MFAFTEATQRLNLGSSPGADGGAMRVDARDAAAVCALAAVAFAVALAYVLAVERTRPTPQPWVHEMGAAVAFACGRGFVDPGYDATPALAAFLDKRVDRISCDAVPIAAQSSPPNFTQRLYRYMTLAAGMTWRLFGISWTRLAALHAALYAVSAASLYWWFRLVSRRLVAIATTLAMVVSPLQLRYLPDLRDYAKAPFVLLLLLVIASLVFRPFTPRRTVLLAASYGAIAGIGFGFRNDLLVAALPFVVTIAAFLPIGIRTNLGTRIAALAIGIASFAVCAWPIIAAYRGGSNTGHVAFLGLMTRFDAPLGVVPSVYDWGSAYDDGYAVKVISSFAERVQHRSVTPLSAEYDRAMVEYLLLIARNWPADLVIRGYASVLRIVELPFQMRLYVTSAPPGVESRTLQAAYGAYVGALSRLSGAGTLLTLVALVGGAAREMRISCWCLAALLYFGGYPAIQFDARHFFFLEAIAWLALAAVVSAIPPRLRWQPAGVFAAMLVLIVVAPISIARQYQQRHLEALIDAYIGAPTATLTVSADPGAAGHVMLRAAELAHHTESGVRAEYLVAEAVGRGCSRPTVPVTVRYVTRDGYTDLSRRFVLDVSRGDAVSRLMVPVYYSDGGYFDGLELDEPTDRACIARVGRVTDLARTPFLINLVLPADWRVKPLYQRLAPRGVRFGLDG